MEREKILKEVHFADKSVFPINIFKSEMIIPEIHKIPRHFHSEMEIIYFREGGVIYEVDYIPHRVEKESIILIPRNSIHSGVIYDFSKHKNIVYIFDFSILESPVHDFCSNKFILPVKNGEIKFPSVIENSKGYFGILKEILLKIYELNEEKRTAYELEIKSKLMQFFSELYKNNLGTNISDKTNRKSNKKNITKVFDFIHNNFDRNISRKDVVKILGVSDSQFTRIFKDVTGNTFSDYLNTYRIIKSAHLLIHSDLSVTEIAYECGFQEISYFIRVFNKKMEITPSKYRKIFTKKTPLISSSL